MTASEALLAAAMTALGGLEGVGVYDGPPVRASVPYAVVEIGLETDWRLRHLIGEAEAALSGLGDLPGWALVNLRLVRSRLMRGARHTAADGWTGLIEFQVRMLALEPG